MVTEELPESVELTRAEQAIVDILTQYYLEELIYDYDENERPIIRKKKHIALRTKGIDDEVEQEASLILPKITKSKFKRKGYGSMLYLLTAIKLATENRVLVSRDGVTKDGKLLWENFIDRGLARFSGEDSKNSPTYEFLDMSKFNIEKLENESKKRAHEIKSDRSLTWVVRDVRTALSQLFK